MPILKKLPVLLVVMVCSLLVFWKVGYNIMWQRMMIDVNGSVVHSVDVPATGAPAYATAYVFREEDGAIKEYVATDDKSSLERSMPTGTLVSKKKWDFGYLKNAEWIPFLSPLYLLSIMASVFGLFGGLSGLLHVWQERRMEKQSID